MLIKLRRDERGIALATVMLVAFVLMALVASTLAFATRSLELSRHDQDWNASLAGAEGGIDDYLYRLNRVDGYWQYGDPADGKPAPTDGNQAFTDWVTMPGGGSEAEYRYSVDTSNFLVDGTIEITATGRVRGTTRTVSATLRRRNFLDYLYFTEYETKDPVLYTTATDGPGHTPAWAQANCARHYYDVPPRHNDCTDIYFFTRDVIGGPLHTNDAMLISGSGTDKPRFLGDTSTSWDDPADKRWLGSGDPYFANAPEDPKWLPPLTMPPSNSALKLETDPTYGGTGCLYTGPTRITLNSAGTMSVRSPLTRSTNTGCGTSFTGGATRTVALPPNGVVFVQGVPISNPSDPNYRSSCPSTHPLGYGLPQGDVTPYNSCAGDVFLSGSLKGRVTIASANNIVVVDHTTYAGGLSGTDLLGLVADNYVEIYHPVECTSPSCDEIPTRSNGTYFTNAQLHAAILSVKHSFRVQNYQVRTAKGQLRIRGAIAQRYRGAVGTFSGDTVVSGYEKDYVYDQRLKYQSPPHFLDPVKSAWHVATWAESRPAF